MLMLTFKLFPQYRYEAYHDFSNVVNKFIIVNPLGFPPKTDKQIQIDYANALTRQINSVNMPIILTKEKNRQRTLKQGISWLLLFFIPLAFAFVKLCK